MADIKKIKIGEETYNIRDNRIITLTDGGSTTAGTWIANTDSPTQNLTAYADGQLFIYKITQAGASTTTLNIDGLGAKTVYRSGSTKVTTHYGVGTYLLLVYSSSLNSGCFMVLNDYDANTNATHSGIGICSTAAATAAKVVTLPKLVLTTNQTILVRVNTTNSATSGVTLNVNSTGAKSIKIGGSAWSTSNQLNAGDYLATYDGTYWNLTRIYLTDNNTHNSHKINSGKKSDNSTDIISATASSGDITLGDSGVTAGTYKRVTVNSKGIVVGGDNTDADTNTWRKVQLNGTDKLGTGTNTNPLNIKAGSNMTITESSGTFTFAATDTTYSSKEAASGGTAVSLVTTGEKYTWNSKADGSHTHDYLSTSGGTLTNNTSSNAVLTIANSSYSPKLTFSASGGGHNPTISLAPDATGSTTGSYTVYLPAEDGTLALTSDIPTSMAWTSITGKPTSFTPSSHNQASSTINAMTGYSKPSATSAISTSDTLNAAIGKLEKALDGKAASSHTHDVSIAASSGTNELTLAHGTKYALTAGGQSFVFTMPSDNNSASAADNILDGSNSGTTITYAPYASGTATSTWVGTDANAGKLYLGTVNPSKTTRLNYNGYLYGTKLYSGGTEVLTKNTAITGATKCKITYDADGLVTAGANLAASDIPSLAASKITSGTFDSARIPNLASSKITAMTGYSKASSVAAISTSDSLNTAIGKLEKALDGKQASGSYVSSHNASMTGSLEIWDSVNEYGYINLGFGYDGYDEEGCVKLTHTDSDNYTTYAISGISHEVNSTSYTYSFPNKSGTLALTSDIKSLVSNNTASGGIKYITEASFTNGVLTLESKYLHLS